MKTNQTTALALTGGKEPRNEFGFRSIFFGIAAGVILLTLSIYLDAVAGMDFNASPVATMLGIVLIPLFGGAATKREINMMQTCSTAVAYSCFALTGNYISTLLAGETFRFIPVLICLILANLIGICFITLFREQFIYDPKLAFPMATIELTALNKLGNLKGSESRILFSAIVISFIISLSQNFGLLPSTISFNKWLPENMTLGILIMPMMIGMGYILGVRCGLCMAVVTLFVSLILGPAGTSRGWFISPAVDNSGLQTFVLPVVVGIFLAASFLPLLSQWRNFAGMFSFKKQKSGEDQNRCSVRLFLLLFALSSAALIIFANIVFGIRLWHMVFCIVISLLLAIISVRVQAESGLSASYALNLFFLILSWFVTRDIRVSLMLPTLAVPICCLAMNTMGDLKVGSIVGSSPQKQVWAQIIGVIAGSLAGLTIFSGLLRVYGLDSELFSYPVAHIYESLVTGLADAEAGFSFAGVAAGGAAGILLSILNLPAAAIALAAFLPGTTILATALGGIIRLIVEKTKGADFADRLNNAATGCIIGDAISCFIFVVYMLVVM